MIRVHRIICMSRVHNYKKNLCRTGVVSNVGQYPSADTADQDNLLGIGPMCRFAEDLGPILQVLAGKNADLLKLQSKVDISKLKVSSIS